MSTDWRSDQNSEECVESNVFVLWGRWGKKRGWRWWRRWWWWWWWWWWGIWWYLVLLEYNNHTNQTKSNKPTFLEDLNSSACKLHRFSLSTASGGFFSGCGSLHLKEDLELFQDQRQGHQHPLLNNSIGSMYGTYGIYYGESIYIYYIYLYNHRSCDYICHLHITIPVPWIHGKQVHLPEAVREEGKKPIQCREREFPEESSWITKLRSPIFVETASSKWVFPKNRGNPKSWILIGFSIINHPFWGTMGTPIFGNIQMVALFVLVLTFLHLSSKKQAIPRISWLNLLKILRE